LGKDEMNNDKLADWINIFVILEDSTDKIANFAIDVNGIAMLLVYYCYFLHLFCCLCVYIINERPSCFSIRIVKWGKHFLK
jgi:hypothetical protein